jgi:hydrogenase maturation protease
MTPRRCIVGIGQRAAGDDAVGFAVVEELRRRELAAGIELHCLSTPLELVTFLESSARVVLVDAVLGSPAGHVRTLELRALERGGAPASSHGIGVLQALELASALGEATVPTDIRVVGVTVERPQTYREGLSPPVAAAVSTAADRALELLENDDA